MKLRVLIADDDPLARASVRAFLCTEPSAEIVGECGDGQETVEAICRHHPDLLFLDLDMPELDGFGVLQAVGAAAMPAVIFVTGHEEHAVQAWDVHALDYLVKPFGLERFRRAFQHARAVIKDRSAESLREQRIDLLERLAGAKRESNEKQPLDCLVVRSGSRMLLVRAGTVDWINAEGNYARLHVGSGSYLIRETMGHLEARLDPRCFARIHRSTIVNLERVRELRPLSGGDYTVLLHDDTELKLSRGYREPLQQRLRTSL